MPILEKHAHNFKLFNNIGNYITTFQERYYSTNEIFIYFETVCNDYKYQKLF